jgi:ubiquinone/menaquinone biosynthesis C-methylase UbiE
MSIDLRAAWNQVAADYQSRQAIPSTSAHYGPWAPSENELRLLGNVSGLHILEIGCGGGQCSIAFARQGAVAVGVDLSDAQLEHARRRAVHEGVDVSFVQGSAEDLSAFADAGWDVIFSAYAFQYIADMPRCLRECARVLRPGGRLVFSLDHPIRICFFDDEEHESSLYPTRSYFDHRPIAWIFGDTGVWMHSHHRTIAEWIDMLSQAGFCLQRLVEPSLPQSMLDEKWPEDDPLSVLRNIPATIIFVAVLPDKDRA